jgi:hypothetical protein
MPLWSSGQSSWLQIQRSGFDFRRYQIFWRVVGLKRGPLSLLSTTEGLLGRKSSCSGLENRQYGRRDPSRWTRGTIYPQKIGSNFADRRRSLGRYSSLADPGHGFFLLLWITDDLDFKTPSNLRRIQFLNVGFIILLLLPSIYLSMYLSIYLSAKFGTNFANKCRSFGWYSSLADSS